MFEGMTVIGENINATRKIKADGKKVHDLGDGRKGYPYTTIDGRDAYLDLTEMLRTEIVQKTGRIGYIAAGIVARDEAFLAGIGGRQVQHGADYLDCCVDEISPDSAERVEHMQWAVRTLQKHVQCPLSLDSSDEAVIRAGLDVYDHSAGTPMINSINLEPARLPLLEIARDHGTKLIANASGAAALPASVEERLDNLAEMMSKMDEADIELENRVLDPLVLPISTNPESGQQFLTTCERLRAEYGDRIHITGGFSNVSFGLPRRRLVNEAMTYMARQAGCDVAFIDPLQVSGFRPEQEGFQKAMAALRGEDMYCMQYITFCRG